MDVPYDMEALTEAFSGGLGIEEDSLITILGSSSCEQRRLFRKKNTEFFVEDERSFQRWDDHGVKLLKHEFMRFKNGVVLWMMHPWERDARLIKEALVKGPQYKVIVEIACTRSSEELLGARKAYHSLFDLSVEEDIASHANGCDRKLLVGLVSAYRYEGPKIREEIAKTEAKLVCNSIISKEQNMDDDNDELIRILTTRSKLHLKALYNYYDQLFTSNMFEDMGENWLIRDTFLCLCNPLVYFSKVLDEALSYEADKNTKKGLTRVIVTQADQDSMQEINEEYQKIYGVSLSKKIEERANGTYRDFLLTLIASEN